MTQSRAGNLTGCGLPMGMCFAEKTYTAMAVQAVVCATALVYQGCIAPSPWQR